MCIPFLSDTHLNISDWVSSQGLWFLGWASDRLGSPLYDALIHEPVERHKVGETVQSIRLGSWKQA